MNLFLLVLVIVACFGDNRRIRLLLNDPTQNELMKLLIQNLTAEISLLKTDNAKLESKVQLLIQNQQGSGGALFIRWGHKTCPDNDSEMVYSGYAGGSGYMDTGGSSEFLCLTPKPVFTGKTRPDEYSGYLYGTEYESLSFFAHNGQDEDVPCSVCRSRSRSTKLIIPGTNICENGWKREYFGYLAGNNHRSAGPEQWICVDKNAEFLPGGSRNDNGRVLHPVSTVCGSLQCPPYENNKVVTCVVCTK